jgi:hypothetical protein
MDKNSVLKGKIIKGKKLKASLDDDSDEDLGDAKKSLKAVKKLIGDDDEKPKKKKKKGKKAAALDADEEEEPAGGADVKTATKKASKPAKPLKTLSISGKPDSAQSNLDPSALKKTFDGLK